MSEQNQHMHNDADESEDELIAEFDVCLSAQLKD
jgi:hypothetical protein